jgi:prophage regulatory protein
MQLLTVKEVCERTTFSRTTLWRRVRENCFPKPLKFGSRIAFDEADLKQWALDQKGPAHG